MPTQGTEGAEGIGGEEHTVRLLVGEHHLRPMYHRCHKEGELMLTYTQGVTTLYLMKSRRDPMEATEHLEGLLIAYDLHIRVALAQQAYRATVVGLHVIDDKVV